MADDTKLGDEAIAAGLAGLAGLGARRRRHHQDLHLRGVHGRHRLRERHGRSGGRAADHHPDMAVGYKRVTVTLSTHSSGGISQKDLDLAAALEALA